jgi:hypothetical protein
MYAVFACVKADRFSSICQVILSNLKLDIYGQLTIGTMTFSRKVIYTYQAITSTYQACSHVVCCVSWVGLTIIGGLGAIFMVARHHHQTAPLR